MSGKNRVVFRKLLIFSLVLCLLFSFSYVVYAEETIPQENSAQPSSAIDQNIAANSDPAIYCLKLNKIFSKITLTVKKVNSQLHSAKETIREYRK